MRYRQLDANGDYTIGLPFYTNVPQTVAQAVQTRLKLWAGEWFMDATDGTPYNQSVLGKQIGKNPDVTIKQRILGTPGVTGIVSYQSGYVGNTRALSVSATINTLYGQIVVQTLLTAGG